MIYGVFLLHFMCEISVNWISFSAIDIFVIFSVNLLRRKGVRFFLSTKTNIDNEVVSYLAQV